MKKVSATIAVNGRNIDTQELDSAIGKLKDGRYQVYVFDETDNKNLPPLKYLFGIVLKTISENLPEHPPVDSLYRYFEEVYAPMHTCRIGGELYEYFDLKNEKASEISYVTDLIIRHAKNEWGIDIKEKDILKMPQYQEVYAGACADDWKNAGIIINS